MSAKIIKHFPFPTIRQNQLETLQKLENNWDNFNYFVMQLPTGFGKSPVSKAIGSSVQDTFLLTVTKQLQDQYVRDFDEKEVVSLKGKANYICNINPELNVECGPCIVNSELLKDCKENSICSYYTQREKALRAQIAVTSIPFFLYSTTCGRYWKPRDVIIVDECHLLEQQLVQWATTSISPLELENEYDIKVPKYKEASGYENNKKWLNRVWSAVIRKREELMEEVKEMLNGRDPSTLSEDELEEITLSHGSYYKIDKLYKKLEIFFKSPNKESWLCEPQEDGLVVTPVEIQDIFHRFVKTFATKKVIFMSATILDMIGFCKSLGLKKEETALINIDSSFPPEKSPIIYRPVGSMNMKNLDNTIPKIIEEVKNILKQHKNEKGIIHTGNYKVAKAIMDSIDDKRLIMKEEGENNEMLVQRHLLGSSDSVVVSPSLTTGVDLKDDDSRFQIIVKAPFLSLADPRVKKKMEMDQDWYVCEMFRVLVQAAGRSTRTEEDYSTSYVLDSSFYSFTYRYRRWLPNQFLKRIIWKQN